MPAELTIRDARGEDLDAVSALLIDAYAQFMPPPRELTAEERAGWDGYRRNIADVWSRVPVSSTIVAEREGKLLGSVNYYAPGQADSLDDAWPDGWASIRLLGVSPQARSLGIDGGVLATRPRRRRNDDGIAHDAVDGRGPRDVPAARVQARPRARLPSGARFHGRCVPAGFVAVARRQFVAT